MGRILPWMDVAYRRWSVWDLMTRLESVNLHPDDLSVFEFKTKDGVPRMLACPYCNEIHELASLCSHLGQEHVYESTYASCPICDWNHKKMLYHIVVVHGYLLDRRDYLQYFHRIRASAMNRTSPLAAMSRNNISIGIGNSSNQSTFVHALTPSAHCEEQEEEEEFREEKSSGTDDASLTPEEREGRRTRAEFVQGLVISSFLEED